MGATNVVRIGQKTDQMWACHNDREDDLVGLPARAE
jgi:hypothetical protein